MLLQLPQVADDRGDLLSAIRNFKGAATLKPAAERVETEPAAEDSAGGDDLAAALRNALLARKKDLRSDSDEDDDESEEESDWE